MTEIFQIRRKTLFNQSINGMLQASVQSKRQFEHATIESLNEFPFLILISGPRPYLKGFIPFADNISFNSFLKIKLILTFGMQYPTL